jgi:hypothetical protein
MNKETKRYTSGNKKTSHETKINIKEQNILWN